MQRIRRSVLVQPENGEATFSVSEYSALRAGIFKAWGLSIRWRLGGARTSPRAPVHRLDEPTGIIPRHGCVPAVPASVSPGQIIVAPPRHAVLNFRVARHSPDRCPPKTR